MTVNGEGDGAVLVTAELFEDVDRIFSPRMDAASPLNKLKEEQVPPPTL